MDEKQEEMFEKIKKEYEQLEKLSDEEKTTIVKGYHEMITDNLSKALKSIETVQRLSPITVPITKTAIIIAESDFISKNKLRVAGIVGHYDSVKTLLESLWEQIPAVFEEVCKAKGFSRSVINE